MLHLRQLLPGVSVPAGKLPETGPGPARRPRDDEIDVYGLTHPGKVRTDNQDHFLICSLQKHIKLFHTSLPDTSRVGGDERVAFISVVADGVGGHAGGEEASRFALQGITRYVTEAIHVYYTSDPDDDEKFRNLLEESALKVHSELASRAEAESRRGMATTLTLWLGVWPYAYLLQVGDSRCYSLRDGHLVQMSRDQTMAEDFVDQGIFTRDDPAHARLSHILSSAIGGPEAAPVVRRYEQNWNNIGLLCSDGLTRHVSDERIRERLMNLTSAKQACEALLQDALDGGGEDNITIAVGRCVPKD
jgi:serine/threonine protein phosphatase PrpC